MNRTPSFNLSCKSGKARAGTLNLRHGQVETPVFMPVGTQATVKTVRNSDLREDGWNIILGNTYHLYLRPGLELLEQAGGLHSFMNWERNILTDSGGFQLFSLSALRKVTEEGYNFQSHIDGSRHILTPEKVIEAQMVFGSDVMMVLDECLEQPSGEKVTEDSVGLTLRWAERARKLYPGNGQAMFGIVQGGGFPHLREKCARELVEMNFDGYAIGGVAVGEERLMMELAVKSCIDILPENRPRYLMGVGKPEDLIDFVAMGVDMFDCVVPTRNARGACFFVPEGRINIRNAKYRNDFRPVQEDCDCFVCTNHTRAYLRHLFVAKEWLAPIFATLHNLRYFARLTEQLREAIRKNRFENTSQELLKKMGKLDNC
ncbi:tRNA guanosine(34) transglycosylase Tgt [Candidatus Fermentibacteria bacterium]|nr:MAG: tRNA guanosine(34) transglycosylase Tgt [Candidatus Fermentibacteria bacterium]